MALPIETSMLFARKVQEAWLLDAEEDEVDQRKTFLKPSSSGYHKQQTSSKGKGPAAGKSSASDSQAKRQVQKGSVLTPSGPKGSPPIVVFAPSSPVYKPIGGHWHWHWLRAQTTHTSFGQSVRAHPGEKPSCGVPSTLYKECQKGGRIMPPCGGDAQQGGPRIGPATISRLLQQPLLGAKKVTEPEAGYKSKASESLYNEREVQDGDCHVYPESVVSRRLDNIHRPEGCVHPSTRNCVLNGILP